MSSRDYNVGFYFYTGSFYTFRGLTAFGRVRHPITNVCKIGILRISQDTNLEHDSVNPLQWCFRRSGAGLTDLNHVRRQWTMLILTRRPSETLMIGDNVTVTVLDIQGGRVRLGVNAPRDIIVNREELCEKTRRKDRMPYPRP